MLRPRFTSPSSLPYPNFPPLFPAQISSAQYNPAPTTYLPPTQNGSLTLQALAVISLMPVTPVAVKVNVILLWLFLITLTTAQFSPPLAFVPATGTPTDFVFAPVASHYYTSLSFNTKFNPPDQNPGSIAFLHPARFFTDFATPPITTGSLAHLAVVSFDIANAGFILATPAVHCSATLTSPTGSSYITPIVVTSYQPTATTSFPTSVRPFENRGSYSNKIAFYFYSPNGEKFDVIPSGTIISTQCPSQIGFFQKSPGPVNAPASGTFSVTMSNFSSTNITCLPSSSIPCRTLVPALPNLTSSINIPAFTPPSTPLLSSTTSILETPHDDQPNFQVKFTYTPIQSRSTTDPDIADVINFFFYAFDNGGVGDILGDRIGLPCITPNAKVVGLMQPRAERASFGKLKSGTPLIDNAFFSSITATETCTVTFHLPMFFAYLTNPELNGVYGINGFPIAYDLTAAANILALPVAYKINSGHFYDDIDDSSYQLVEVQGPDSTRTSVQLFLTGFSMIVRPALCFWDLDQLGTVTPYSSLSAPPTCTVGSSTTVITLESHPLVLGCYILPTSISIVASLKCLASATVVNMSVHRNSDEFPLTSFPVVSGLPITLSYNVPHRILRSTGSYYSTTDSTFFPTPPSIPSVEVAYIPTLSPGFNNAVAGVYSLQSSPTTPASPLLQIETTPSTALTGDCIVYRISTSSTSLVLSDLFDLESPIIDGTHVCESIFPARHNDFLLVCRRDGISIITAQQFNVKFHLTLKTGEQAALQTIFNQLRFAVYAQVPYWIALTNNVLTLPTVASSISTSTISISSTIFETPQNVVEFNIPAPGLEWYQLFQQQSTEELELEMFPRLLYNQIQLFISNECSRYAMAVMNTEMPNLLDTIKQTSIGCMNAFTLNIVPFTFPQTSFVPTQTPSIEPPRRVLIKGTTAQPADPLNVSWLTHQGWTITLSCNNAVDSAYCAGSPYQLFQRMGGTFASALRELFPSTIIINPTGSPAIQQGETSLPTSAGFQPAKTSPRLSRYLTTDSTISGSAYFNTPLVFEPSIRVPTTTNLRALSRGEQVRFQINWFQYLNTLSPSQAELEMLINSWCFTLIGALPDATALPLSISRMQPSLRFPHSFPIPYTTLTLSTVAIAPRPEISASRPTSLSQVLPTTLPTHSYPITGLLNIHTGSNLYPIQFSSRFDAAGLPTISASTPGLVVSLLSRTTTSVELDRSLQTHFLTVIASTWLDYAGNTVTQFIDGPKRLFDANFIDYRRFSVGNVPPPGAASLQGKSAGFLPTKNYIIARADTPFFRNVLKFVLDGMFEYLSESPETANLSSFCNAAGAYCVDVLALPISSPHMSPATQTVPIADLVFSQIPTTLTGLIDKTYAYLETTTISDALASLATGTTTPKFLKSMSIFDEEPVLWISRPILFLPTQTSSVLSVIYVNDIPIPPRAPETISNTGQSYPILIQPFQQHGFKPFDPLRNDYPTSTVLPYFSYSDDVTYKFAVFYKLSLSEDYLSIEYPATVNLPSCENIPQGSLSMLVDIFEGTWQSSCVTRINGSEQHVAFPSRPSQTNLYFSLVSRGSKANLVTSSWNTYNSGLDKLLFTNDNGNFAFTQFAADLITREIELAMSLSGVKNAHVEYLLDEINPSHPASNEFESYSLSLLHTSSTALPNSSDFFGPNIGCNLFSDIPSFTLPPGTSYTFQKLFDCTTAHPPAQSPLSLLGPLYIHQASQTAPFPFHHFTREWYQVAFMSHGNADFENVSSTKAIRFTTGLYHPSAAKTPASYLTFAGLESINVKYSDSANDIVYPLPFESSIYEVSLPVDFQGSCVNTILKDATTRYLTTPISLVQNLAQLPSFVLKHQITLNAFGSPLTTVPLFSGQQLQVEFATAPPSELISQTLSLRLVSTEVDIPAPLFDVVIPLILTGQHAVGTFTQPLGNSQINFQFVELVVAGFGNYPLGFSAGSGTQVAMTYYPTHCDYVRALHPTYCAPGAMESEDTECFPLNPSAYCKCGEFYYGFGCSQSTVPTLRTTTLFPSTWVLFAEGIQLQDGINAELVDETDGATFGPYDSESGFFIALFNIFPQGVSSLTRQFHINYYGEYLKEFPSFPVTICNNGYFGNSCALSVNSVIYLGQQSLPITGDVTGYSFTLTRSTVTFLFDTETNSFNLSPLYTETDFDAASAPLPLEFTLTFTTNGSSTSIPLPLTQLDRCSYLSQVNSLACVLPNTSRCIPGNGYNPAICQCKPDWQGPTCSQVGPSLGLLDEHRQIRMTYQPSASPDLYYKIALEVYPDATLNQQVHWITADYTYNSNQMVDAPFVPSSVTTLLLNIPPLPDIVGGVTVFLVPTDPTKTTPEVTLSTTQPILSRCSDPTAPCAGALCNSYQPSTCSTNISIYATGVCEDLTCPRPLSKDLVTCSCVCTTSLCVQNTRVAMLYFVEPTETEMHWIQLRSKSLISRTMKLELSIRLGLNIFPTSTQYVDSKENASVPPVGCEELTLLPISFSTLSPAQIVAFISMKQCISGSPIDPQAPGLTARFSYLETRLRTIMNSQPFQYTTNPQRFPAMLIWTSQIAIGQFNSYLPSLINLATTTVPATKLPPKLTTRCINPTTYVPTDPANPTTFTTTCPTVAQSRSPFWGQCSSQDANGEKALTVQCIDYAGRIYTDPGSSWCSSNAIFPNFPTKTKLPCSPIPPKYDPPELSNIVILPSSPGSTIQAGTTVKITWVYNATANPTFTIDIFVQPDSNPIGFSINTDFEDRPLAMTPQQSIANGYRVLLGTFPATTQSAIVAIPETILAAGSSNFQVKFSLRVTQAAQLPPKLSPSIYFISAKDLCATVQCANPNTQECNKHGVCVCKALFKLDQTSQTCVPKCDGICGDNGICDSATGSCRCTSPFTGDLCNIDSNCFKENKELCNNHGTVRFESGQCGKSCNCFTNLNWDVDTTLSTPNCNKCTLLDSFCGAGTNVTRTPRRGCDKCYCSAGFTGETCTLRAMYGTILFGSGSPYVISPSQTDTNKPIILTLDDDITAILVRDMALSMNIPESSVFIKQAISLATPSPLNVAQSTGGNAVTFEFLQDQNTGLSDLYDLWKNVQDNTASTPIGQPDSDASGLLGQATGVQDAYDPQCDATTTSNCPTGPDPFVDEDPAEEEPLVPEITPTTGVSTSSTVIAIVVPVVIAGAILIGAIVVVVCLKKRQRACFKPLKDDNNEHLELTSSDTSAARFGESISVPKSRSATKQSSVKQTAYSSGTSTSVDLIECPLDKDEPELPKNWRKMKHTATGDIIFVNDEKMTSQKAHPASENGPKPSWE